MHISSMSNQQHIEAAGGVILDEKGYLLMIFRREKWDLPKGKIDEGESPEQAAVREVKEETGIQVAEIIKTLGTTEHEYFDYYNQLPTRKTTHWFLMSSPSNLPLIPQISEDITHIKWVSPTELPSLLTGSYDNIRDIVQRAGLLQ